MSRAHAKPHPSHCQVHCADSVVHEATPKGEHEGGWDSIHVFEVVDRGRVAHYKLTSTVILHLGARGDALGALSLGGNLTRQIEQDLPVENDGSHIVNVGRMVEDMEIKIRNLTRESCVGLGAGTGGRSH